MKRDLYEIFRLSHTPQRWEGGCRFDRKRPAKEACKRDLQLIKENLHECRFEKPRFVTVCACLQCLHEVVHECRFEKHRFCQCPKSTRRPLWLHRPIVRHRMKRFWPENPESRSAWAERARSWCWHHGLAGLHAQTWSRYPSFAHIHPYKSTPEIKLRRSD